MPDGYRIPAAILGGSIAIGLSIAGFAVSETVYKGKVAENTVTVKGFAERDVRSDLALWQITYSMTGGDLPSIYDKSTEYQKAVNSFLQKEGFAPQEIEPGQLQINDQLSSQYRSGKITPDQRYIVQNTIVVRSRRVDLVNHANLSLTDLIKQGVPLTANSVNYQFTRLGDIKAPMLKDATENARQAAQQFADDAGSRVGSIQSASQGFFSVAARDNVTADEANDQGADSSQVSTIDQKVRVVVSLTYYLVR